MTRISIIPSTNKFYLSIPQQYIGKEVEVLVFPKSEVMEMAKTENKSMASLKEKDLFFTGSKISMAKHFAKYL